MFWDVGNVRRVAMSRKSEMRRSKIPVLPIAFGISLSALVPASATQAVAQQAPAIQIGSDTRAKSAEKCLEDAKFAITETGLQVSFTSGPHIGGAGTLEGAGVAVVVTCLSQGARTFIEVIGASLNGSAAEQARNRVRTITMGPPS
jgi:hypothetical protein